MAGASRRGFQQLLDPSCIGLNGLPQASNSICLGVVAVEESDGGKWRLA